MAQTSGSMKDDISTAARDTLETARGEIAALRAQVESLMADKVSPALSHVADQARDTAKAAADAVQRQTHAAADTIRAQPFAAIGAAALIGIAVGLILRR